VNRTGGGLLVAPDDPDALAEGLHQLLADRARAAEIGQAGADGVRRHYSVEGMAMDAERVYRALGDRPRAPGPGGSTC
jgi:glycosyltransferase involved in cell wall biosynthesis